MLWPESVFQRWQGPYRAVSSRASAVPGARGISPPSAATSGMERTSHYTTISKDFQCVQTATYSTTPIQKSGGKLFSPSGLPRSHFARVQCVIGFQTWKNGRYGFSSRLLNGSSGVGLLSPVDGEMVVGCVCPEGMIRSFSYNAPAVKSSAGRTRTVPT